MNYQHHRVLQCTIRAQRAGLCTLSGVHVSVTKLHLLKIDDINVLWTLVFSSPFGHFWNGRTRVQNESRLDQFSRSIHSSVGQVGPIEQSHLVQDQSGPRTQISMSTHHKKLGPPLKVHVCFGWSVFSSHVCTERNIKMDGSQILFKFCVLSQKYGYIFTNKCQNGPTYDTKYCSNAIHIRLID